MKLWEDPLPAAVREFHDRQGWTQEQLADAVCASPLEVAAWEAGAVRVPLEQARLIRRCDVEDRRAAAIAAAALPKCHWADQLAPDLHATLLEGPGSLDWILSAEARFHLEDCTACRRVRKFGLQLRHVRADPDLGDHPVESAIHFIMTGPRALVWGVLIVDGFALLIAGFSLLTRLPFPTGVWSDAGLGVGMGMLAFMAAARSLRPLTARRPFLSGLLKSAAGVAAGMLWWEWFSFDYSPLLDRAVLAGGALLAAAGGLLAGWWSKWRGEIDDEPAHQSAPVQPGVTPSAVPHVLPPPVQPELVSAPASHLLQGIRVPAMDAAPPPRAEPVPDRRRSR
ncbi:MAG TPA: helix-turn-helix transcriptional regulator [Longimicrobium sp.]|nr:helix-turn-helix transcriptional regulator [Longimicrobium sp.]